MFNEFQLISGLLHEEMCLLSCVADLCDSIGILDNQVNVLKKILSTFGQRTGGTRTELQRRIMEIIQIIIISEDLEALEAALTDPEVDVDYKESNKR
mmetsp:Transcript_5664/g.6965  ORF Transcript_5664/g.6965 Transcript_5664/m.6965 type:complete len:97 (+) Transcript_5664:349-639(+)